MPMNEAEMYELIALYFANGTTAFTVYISFTFGYLSAAYFVGRELSFKQVVVVSTIYVFSASSAILSIIAQASTMVAIQSELAAVSKIYSQIILLDARYWLYGMPVLLVAGILGSIYFMSDIRKGMSASEGSDV